MRLITLLFLFPMDVACTGDRNRTKQKTHACFLDSHFTCVHCFAVYSHVRVALPYLCSSCLFFSRGGNSAVSVSDSVLILIGIVSRYLSTTLSFGRNVSRQRRIIMSRVNAAQLGKRCVALTRDLFLKLGRVNSRPKENVVAN